MDIYSLSIRADTTQVKDARTDLRNLGKESQVAGKAAEKMGGSVKVSGRNAGQAGIQFQQFVGQVQGGTDPMIALSQQAADLGFVLGVPLAGAIAGITASIAGPLISAFLGSSDAAESFVEEINKLIDSADELNASQEALVRSDLEDKIKAEKQALFDARIELRDYKEGLAETTESLRNFGLTTDGASLIANKFAGDQTALEKAVALSEARVAAAERQLKEFGESANEATEDVRTLTENLSEQAAVVGLEGRQLALAKVEQLEKNGADARAVELARMQISRSYELIEAQERREEAEKAATKAAREAESEDQKRINTYEKLVHSLTTKTQALQLSGSELAQYEAVTKLAEGSTAEMKDTVSGLAAEFYHQEQAAKAAEKELKNQERAAQRIEDAFTEMFMNFDDGLGGMLQGFLGVLRQMAAEAAAAQIFGSIKNTDAVSGVTAAVGGLLSFDGGGYTGSGPRSGGMDGQGGFPAMLHPNETVVDHTKGGSMGSTNVVVNVDANGSSVRGDQDGAQLGRLIGAGVRQVLLQEKRPGGMLS